MINRLFAVATRVTAMLLVFLGSAQAAERTLEGAFEPVVISGTPQRVVVLDDSALDAALAVGVKPVGALASRGGTDVPDYLKEKAGTVAIVGAVREPNLEAVLMLQPDLIIASSELPKAQYDRLKLIAPTVVPGTDVTQDWRKQLAFYGHALNKDEESKQRISEVEDRLAALRERVSDAAHVSVIRWNAQGPFIMASHLFAGQMLDAVGFKPNELATQTRKPHTDILSLENLGKADADWVFLATLNDDGRKALEAAKQQPAFQRLGAVRNDQVIPVDGDVWSSSSGYFAAQHVLDDIEKVLKD